MTSKKMEKRKELQGGKAKREKGVGYHAQKITMTKEKKKKSEAEEKLRSMLVRRSRRGKLQSWNPQLLNDRQNNKKAGVWKKGQSWRE